LKEFRFVLPFSFTIIAAALCLCLMVLTLLVKLVTDARNRPASGRPQDSIQLERSFFFFLIAATTISTIGAFSLFLPPLVIWGATLGHIMFSIRQGLLLAPLGMIWGRKWMIARGSLVGCVGMALFLVLLFTTETSTTSRQDVLGRCFLCEHFLPLFFSVFVAFGENKKEKHCFVVTLI
jgi:hypothetical protein